MDESAKPEESPKEEPQIEFKKPVLFGRIGKLPKKVKNDTEKAKDDKNIQELKETTTTTEALESKSKSSTTEAVTPKEFAVPIPYKEPKWSGLCPDGSEYSLEVLKSGMIVENIELTVKPYYVFGRLSNCDVVMAHPTISRFHCVLQYKAFAEEGEPPCGWYLYDLGSTHGTFLNKERLKTSHYTRVRVGHQIKFGSSSRTYILVGPDFDCEGESELSVTEIKQRALNMKLNRQRMIEEDRERREKERLEEERKREEQGIDWGMGEDAEEEPDLAENPYASTANEELYLTDPKKTLRGYYEREGHELTYDCEERGVGQFLCRVELPIDDARGNPMKAEVIHRGKKKEAVIACALEACRILDRAGLLRQAKHVDPVDLVKAEVIHRGKKKEAVIACALEACRILDRAGLLRQAKHESRRKKQRDWSADDYYDSDEDTFLDRTGVVERKRKLRMVKHGAAGEEKNQPLTYDSLLKQIEDIESKISSEEKCLERLRSANKPVVQTDDDTDALDAFMSSLGTQGQSMAQKAEISKTKMSIQKLKAELTKTQRLAELARPAHLPPLVKKDTPKMAVKMATNSVVYGKRIRLKEDATKKPKVPKEKKQQQEEEFVEEMDSDDESTPQNNIIEADAEKETTNNQNRSEKQSTSHKKDTVVHKKEEDSSNMEVQESVEDSSKEKRVFGPMRPPENYVIPENYFDQETDRDLPEITDDE